MKIVVDTNVIVSALMNPNGIPAGILALILNGKLKILYDNRIMFEYIDVLSRREFCFESETINNLVNIFKNDGEYINAEYTQIKFTDESDKKFYEVFKSGEAQFLITGNKKHFPKEKAIVTPGEFVSSI